MPKCSFCKNEEDIETPVCQSCGSLRYPIENEKTADTYNSHQILKTSATVAAAIVTPGSFVVLAIVGAAKLIQK